MELSSSFNIGKLNITIDKTHLHIAYSDSWNANIAYSHIKQTVKYFVEKLQEAPKTS